MVSRIMACNYPWFKMKHCWTFLRHHSPPKSSYKLIMASMQLINNFNVTLLSLIPLIRLLILWSWVIISHVIKLSSLFSYHYRYLTIIHHERHQVSGLPDLGRCDRPRQWAPESRRRWSTPRGRNRWSGWISCHWWCDFFWTLRAIRRLVPAS